MMLRNAAAALIVLSTCSLSLAPSALALDAIDLAEAPAAPAAGECPLLVRIKYPFLTCGGAAGGADLLQVKPLAPNASWASARQIPRMSDWTESDGAWGPDLNQD